MKKIDQLLNRLYEEVIQVGDNLKCEVCGRVVLIQEKGKGPLICCGKEMIRIGETVSEAGFDNMPKGWDESSVKKFARNLVDKGGGKSKGFFDKCVKKMSDKIDNPEGFCASVKDEVYGSTYWRGKDKPEKEVRKDTKKKQNV